MKTKYSDYLASILKNLGYTHCFYVTGGNIMHLIESVSKEFICIPVIHEVTAGIATEYFNEANLKNEKKAFALVTAGPGLTNMVTAIAGAYLESRELLIIGGQVKSSDLKNSRLRQKGIQEINGVELVKSICKSTVSIKKPIDEQTLVKIIELSSTPRKGPVFLEICLDVQGAQVNFRANKKHQSKLISKKNTSLRRPFSLIQRSLRPILLLGAGVDRNFAFNSSESLEDLNIPIMTTWNGTDRVSSTFSNYMGRPNTWGQRYANILLQQSDLLIAVGTRLGLQQTGFNWQQFLPKGKVIQVDIDKSELNKKNPKIDIALNIEANYFLDEFLKKFTKIKKNEWYNWLDFSQNVKNLLPLNDPQNTNKRGFLNPYNFYEELSKILKPTDSIIPSSSGGAETVAMQALNQIKGNQVITSKGLASMGYGLGGAIGTAFKTGSRVFHIEGDGGFAQNLQDLGTVKINNLNIKTFIFCNEGYASIRMTQKNYFDGHYVGCDVNTGLGLPNWFELFKAYDIPCMTMNADEPFNSQILNALETDKPHAFLVPVDPEQTYFPKITSRVLPDGSIESNPLHLMTPELDIKLQEKIIKYI